jgi:hypothetical protein
VTGPGRVTLHVCQVCGTAAFSRHDSCFPWHEGIKREPVDYMTVGRPVALLEALRDSWAARPRESYKEGALDALDQAITVLEEDQ